MHAFFEIFVDMYFCVILKESKVKLVVKSLWIKKIPSSTDFGQSAENIIFYSKDLNKIADFDTPIKTEFYNDHDACYKGYILNKFRKYFKLN